MPPSFHRANLYPMRSRALIILCLLSALLPAVTGCSPPPESGLLIQDNFDSGNLDISRWQIIQSGDFASMVVDVIDVDPGARIQSEPQMIRLSILVYRRVKMPACR